MSLSDNQQRWTGSVFKILNRIYHFCMKSKRNFTNSLLIIVLSFVSFNLQLNAQTNVVKVNAIKSNNYGIQYFLPQTVLELTVEYSKITQKAGPYAKYASRYLGVSEESIVMEDQTYCILDKVNIANLGLPNKNESYLIELKSKTTAPFVYLTEDGLICAINADYQESQLTAKESNNKGSLEAVLSINPQSVYTEEYLRAGSVSKMAEVAAKQIYRIRESRSDILTGEAENAPKDGEAMKIVLANLDAQEKVWVNLFTGTSIVEQKTEQFIIEPVAELDKEIMFRFSKYLGVVDRDDLSGVPVYVNLKDLKTVDTGEIDPKRKAKEKNSIVYNVPGAASVEVFYGMDRIYRGEFPVTQFGTTQILATVLFEDKKAPVQVLFYPNIGAIKQVIQ